MDTHQADSLDFTRRHFLKGGSVAAMMTLLGGVEIVAEAAEQDAAEKKLPPTKTKVAVIGLGPRGRELLNTLAVVAEADIVGICDTYPTALRRAAATASGAVQTADYKQILDNKDIAAVVVATPTHQHKDIVLAALKAGKHVYCEAPLAHTIEDARAIALAAREAKQVIFQAGFQNRSDPLSNYLPSKVFRPGALGRNAMIRAQWHKKNSWRVPSPNTEREKEINWRLDKALSLGLAGEAGCHVFDRAAWLLDAQPLAISGFGSLMHWNEDKRELPDTVHAVFEFPKQVRLVYDATLVNSFEGGYETYYGSDAALMLRDDKAWLFKEVDAPLLGFEVYGIKETFYKDTAIVFLAAGPSAPPPSGSAKDSPFLNTPVYFALKNFLMNAEDMRQAKQLYIESYGEDNVQEMNEHLAKTVQRRPASGYLDAYCSTVTAIKANEAILANRRIVMDPEWYKLS